MWFLHDTYLLRSEVLAGELREAEPSARLNWVLWPSPAAPVVGAHATFDAREEALLWLKSR